jgi:hypothetical protein
MRLEYIQRKEKVYVFDIYIDGRYDTHVGYFVDYDGINTGVKLYGDKTYYQFTNIPEMNRFIISEFSSHAVL